MKPGQKLKTPTGEEVILYPMEYLVVSRGDHDGHAFDMLGWNANGRVYNCPCYAPVSGSVVRTGNDHNMIYWSDTQVLFADGTADFCSILVAHSESPPGSVGTHYNQGDLWYHTGNYGNSYGDHLHIDIAKGHVLWNSAGTGLQNSVSLNTATYVNDTVLVNTGGYLWRIYEGGVTPPGPGPVRKWKSKFPWVLYARKMRGSER